MIYLQLFLTFAKVGVMTFGGGMAMLPMLQREIVKNRGWATDEEMLDYYAIGQCTPGIIAVNTATFVGYKQKGIPGAISATLGIIFPSIVIITVLAGVLTMFSGNVYVQKAFAGIRIAVAAQILVSVFRLAKKAITGVNTAVIAVMGFAAQLFLGVSPILITACVIAYGILLYFIRRKDNAAA